MSNRGYAGYYKNFYLRSSYEYAYAKYLDFFSIIWDYEMQIFNIENKLYKPDFFILNPDGTIKKIVEIKSKNLIAIERAKQNLRYIQENYGYEIEVISYQQLLSLYENLPFTLNSVITAWISSNETTISKVAYGNKNGHFNMKHSIETKKKIGEHTRLLWATDSPSRRRMLEGLNKSGVKKGYIRVPREKRNCLLCKQTFTVLITSFQKYCSQSCAGNVAIKIATEASVNKHKKIHKEIKQYVLHWLKDNKEAVLDIPFNRIKTTLAPLLMEIENNFGIKDIRIISKAVVGKNCGRKDLLKFMKDICNENIC